MNLTSQQKKLTIDALKAYWRAIKDQLQPNLALPIIQDIKVVVAELEKVQIINNVNEKPAGVSDEQFERVCLNCDKYEHKCKDIVAMKFPGKCDPILKYKVDARNLPESSVKAMLDAENSQFK